MARVQSGDFIFCFNPCIQTINVLHVIFDGHEALVYIGVVESQLLAGELYVSLAMLSIQ